MPQAIEQVVVLYDEPFARKTAKGLSFVLHEIAALYHLGSPSTEIRSTLVTRVPHEELDVPLAPDRVLPFDDEFEKAFTGAEATVPGTYDHRSLFEGLRRVLPLPVNDERRLVVLTDVELAAPYGSRYFLCGEMPDGWIATVAPTDPAFWGSRDPERVPVVKRRARAIVGRMVGKSLQFEECDNHQCFLFRTQSLDSVLRLDLMRSIGAEHPQIPGREAVGFPPTRANPDVEQPICWGTELQIEGWAAP